MKKKKKIIPKMVRTLSFEDVIELVSKTNRSVRSIEIELQIPATLLHRALRNREMPLPIKYERPLINFVNKCVAIDKETEQKTTRLLSDSGLREEKKVPLSDEELKNKVYWLSALRERISELNHPL